LLLSAATSATADDGPAPEEVADLVAQVAPSAGAVVDVEDTGDDLVATVDGISVAIPTTTNGEITISAPPESTPASFSAPQFGLDSDTIEAPSISLSLPLEIGSAEANVTSGGDVIYQPDEGDTDVVVQALAGGDVRVQTVSNGPDAPTTYTYTVGAGVVPQLLEDGSVALTVPSQNPSLSVEVGTIAAPWAYDANGTAVATHYEVTDSEVIQHVAHNTPGVAYPVIADPTGSVGLGYYWHFNRAETKTFHGYGMAGTAGATAACAGLGGLGGPIGSVVLGSGCAVVAARVIHAASVAENSSPKKCFYIRVVAPTVVGVSAGTYKDSRCR
jgi:hypothetical protein